MTDRLARETSPYFAQNRPPGGHVTPRWFRCANCNQRMTYGPADPHVCPDSPRVEREIGKNRPTFPKLSDEERARVHALIDEYADAHDERVAKHVQRLEQTAHRLGRQVRRHRVTLQDAARQLDALAETQDPRMDIPQYLIPLHESRAVATAAFRAGMNGTRR